MLWKQLTAKKKRRRKNRLARQDGLRVWKNNREIGKAIYQKEKRAPKGSKRCWGPEKGLTPSGNIKGSSAGGGKTTPFLFFLHIGYIENRRWKGWALNLEPFLFEKDNSPWGRGNTRIKCQKRFLYQEPPLLSSDETKHFHSIPSQPVTKLILKPSKTKRDITRRLHNFISYRYFLAPLKIKLNFEFVAAREVHTLDFVVEKTGATKLKRLHNWSF